MFSLFKGSLQVLQPLGAVLFQCVTADDEAQRPYIRIILIRGTDATMPLMTLAWGHLASYVQ